MGGEERGEKRRGGVRREEEGRDEERGERRERRGGAQRPLRMLGRPCNAVPAPRPPVTQFRGFPAPSILCLGMSSRLWAVGADRKPAARVAAGKQGPGRLGQECRLSPRAPRDQITPPRHTADRGAPQGRRGHPGPRRA